MCVCVFFFGGMKGCCLRGRVDVIGGVIFGLRVRKVVAGCGAGFFVSECVVCSTVRVTSLM